MVSDTFFKGSGANVIRILNAQECTDFANSDEWKQIAVKPCDLDGEKDNGICISAVYAKDAYIGGDRECYVEIGICVHHHVHTLNAVRNEEGISPSGVSMFVASLDDIQNPAIKRPLTDRGEDLVYSWVGSDLGPDSPFLTITISRIVRTDIIQLKSVVAIGGYSPVKGRDVVLDYVEIPELECGDVVLYDYKSNCFLCSFTIGNLARYAPYRLVLMDEQGRRLFSREGSGNSMRVEAMCDGLYDGEGAFVQVVAYDGSVRSYPVESFIGKVNQARENNRPKVSVEHIPVSPLSGACLYRIFVETEHSTQYHRSVTLYSGRLDPNAMENVEQYFADTHPDLWGWPPYKWGGMTLTGVESTSSRGPQESQFDVRGPGEYTVIVRYDSCTFAIPVDVPGCLIELEGDGDILYSGVHGPCRCLVEKSMCNRVVSSCDEGVARVECENGESFNNNDMMISQDEGVVDLRVFGLKNRMI